MPRVQATAHKPPIATKIMTIVVENHSLHQMQSGMPYLKSLAKRYGYATDYRAVTHPSLPNYLAIAFGTTGGVHDDKLPSAHRLKGNSVFSLAAHYSSARLYAESMRRSCQRTNTYPYAVKHNAWAYGSSSCAAGDVPAGTPAAGRLHRDTVRGTLPCAGMLVPDLRDDAHDTTLRRADGYLKKWLPVLMRGRDFTSGRLVIVITADEDDRSSRANRVLTVVLNKSISHRVVRSTLTHYSLSRLYGTTCNGGRQLGHAKTARSMRVAFHLP